LQVPSSADTMARGEAAGWTRTGTAQAATAVVARKVRLSPQTEIVLEDDVDPESDLPLQTIPLG